jgi:hypothetical protein
MLEQAGFLYDSTLGYNDAVGFRSGTTQVFRLPETSSVFELPLNVMDTTMFYPDRMGLSETEALRLCRKLIDEMRTYSGVLTINWHTRSLSPERNWDDFYLELLKSLEKEKVWFAKAGDVVKWFLRRRNVSFDDMEVMDDKIRLRLGGDQGDRELSENSLLPLCIRVYSPQAGPRNTKEKSPSRSFIDLPWNGENHACFPI